MRLLYQDHYRFRFSNSITTLDFPPHLHTAVEVAVITQGSCLVQHGNQHTLLSAGDIFVAFPNQIHGYEQSKNTRGYLLIIPLKPYLEAYYNVLMKQIPVTPYLKEGQWDKKTLLPLLEMGCGELPTATETLMQGYLHIIVGKLLSALELREGGSGGEEGLKKILLYINAHYTETISRRSIAKAVGYNESYISHIFSGVLNTTIPEYVNGLRIYDAVRLLRETNIPISQLALQLGFGSVRNFNRVFLKHTGMTPKAYRKT